MHTIRSTTAVPIDIMTYPSDQLPSVFAIDPLHPDVQHMVKGRFRLITCDQPEMLKWKDNADALIIRGSSIAPEDLAQCKRLKWVQKHGVGIDQLDIGALKAANVGLMNTPGANVSDETRRHEQHCDSLHFWAIGYRCCGSSIGARDGVSERCLARAILTTC